MDIQVVHESTYRCKIDQCVILHLYVDIQVVHGSSYRYKIDQCVIFCIYIIYISCQTFSKQLYEDLKKQTYSPPLHLAKHRVTSDYLLAKIGLGTAENEPVKVQIIDFSDQMSGSYAESLRNPSI